MNDVYDDFLVHHGVKGQKWGDRNGPPYPLSQETQTLIAIARKYDTPSTQGTATYNLQKWGKDEEHNALYVMGANWSDTAKIAQGFDNYKKSKVVPVNALYNRPFDAILYSDETRPALNYICKKVPNYVQIMNNFQGHYSKERFKKSKDSEFYWKTMEDVVKAIPEYSKEEFKNGNTVIVPYSIQSATAAKNTGMTAKNLIKGQPTILRSDTIKDFMSSYMGLTTGYYSTLGGMWANNQPGKFNVSKQYYDSLRGLWKDDSLKKVRGQFAREVDAMQAAEYYAFGITPNQ